MRSIKFKVWDSKRKEWLHKYPFALYGETTLMGYMDTRESDNSHVLCEELKDLIPCQYTGLKDKNGVEIYEGDVVLYNLRKDRYVVIFEKGKFLARGGLLTGSKSSYSDIDSFWFSSTIKIIGSIHENPELLK